MESKDKTKGSRHPYDNAGYVSQSFFAWLIPLLRKGYTQDLTEDDIYPVLSDYESTNLGNKLKEEWAKQLVKNKKDPSLWAALAKVFGKELAILGFWYWFFECVVNLCQPIFLSQLLQYYQPHTKMTKNEAYMYSGLLVLASFIPTLFHHIFVFQQFLLGRKIKVATSALVYEKCLKLSKSALTETTVGQMVNLLSNDVGRFELVTKFLQDLWVVPIEIITVMILVHYFVGYTGLIGFACLIFFIPFQIWIGKKASVYRLKTAIKTDERIRLMSEILTGIQVIKMYTWEKPFAKLVQLCRKNEIKDIKHASQIRGISGTFNLFLTRTSIFVCIITYVLFGNALTASYVFVLSSFYNIMTLSLTVRFPQGIMQFSEAAVSIKRIKAFMMYKEVDFCKSDTFLNALPLKGIQDNIGYKIVSPVQVKLTNASTNWSAKPENDRILKNINIDLKNGELAAVIGHVGCGKSTLLHLILKELVPLEGKVNVEGKISYASQEPWLFVGTVRQNIIFGQPYDEERYKEVVKVCALERDFTLFPYGDRTMVGERGVALSGGQKARVNLARAIYKEADIYLLDDPLSAVDTKVGKHIFEECISTYLKDKTVVLVTHQLQYLKEVEKIYLLDNGEVKRTGTYDEIRRSSKEFANLLKNLKGIMRDDDDDDEAIKSKEDSTDVSLTPHGDDPKMDKEGKKEGKVSWGVYKFYLGAGGNCCTIFSVFILCLSAQALCSITDYFLMYWVNMHQLQLDYPEKTADDYTGIKWIWMKYLIGDVVWETYLTLVLLMIIVTICRSVIFYYFCMVASTELHKRMFDKIVFATMRFFKANPSGRVLNRFSMDINQVDEVLPYYLLETIQNFLLVAAIITIVVSIIPWMLIPVAVILVIFAYLRKFYMETSRDMKRLEGTTRSPIYSHLSTTLQGLTTIRAFGAEELVKKEFDDYQNVNSSTYFTFIALARAFGLWLDLHCNCLVALTIFSFLIFDLTAMGGSVGLAVTQSINLTIMFQWAMRNWTELENIMTCVERIREYANIEAEKDNQIVEVPNDWPKEGGLEFRNFSLKYAPGQQDVLKDINIKIEPNEKIGIVGRTGAGKSTIAVALYRLAENSGEILLDGVNIEQISLNQLRSHISIVPQEPVLYSGTIKKNLDPFGEHDDATLWSALEDVELKRELPEGLETKVSEGGSNYSVGQRQLICLARAIVRNKKVLVLDEATANVDPQTDLFIQHTIRRKFSHCTVLTIAHRLHSVMDSDKILVLDAGCVVEFDSPYNLLRHRKGAFYQMIQETGSAMAESLMGMVVSPENESTQL